MPQGESATEIKEKSETLEEIEEIVKNLFIALTNNIGC